MTGNPETAELPLEGNAGWDHNERGPPIRADLIVIAAMQGEGS